MNIYLSDLTTRKARDEVMITHGFGSMVVDRLGVELFSVEHVTKTIDPDDRLSSHCMRCKAVTKTELFLISADISSHEIPMSGRVRALVCAPCFHLHTACGWSPGT